jgi:nanoRNase/pAp phosphatase (c-di-AMP/oligoRNAs hydrolase)
MSLTPEQQFSDLLDRAKEPLILIPKNPSIDTLAGAFALALLFNQRGDRATVVGEELREKVRSISFLPTPETLLDALTGAREFILAFNTARNPIIGIRSAQEDDEFRVYVTPEHGIIDPRDFSFVPAHFKHDLAIVLGAPDKESLGKTYTDNPDLFYELPIVNIDCHANNERFAQVNLVDITASSVSEIIGKIFIEHTKSPIDAGIAECLYTGIVAATESFQKQNTQPKALEIAGKLMDAGVDQQKIIQALYRNDSLALLKLWGRAMSTLRQNDALRLISATVTAEDLVHSRAHPSILPTVLERIRRHSATGQYFLLLVPELSGGTTVYIESTPIDALFPLLQKLSPRETIGEMFVFFFPDLTPEQTEEHIISLLMPKKQS